MQKVVPVARRVNLIIVFSLILRIGGVVTFFLYRTNQTLVSSTWDGLSRESDLLFEAIKNAMLPGQALIAMSLLHDVAELNPTFQIDLFRANGERAFADNKTLDRVNELAGMILFLPKELTQAAPPAEMSAELQRATTERRMVASQSRSGNQTFFTIHRPLLNLPKCTVCHGSDHTIRGVLRLRSDVTELIQRTRNNLLVAVGAFLGIVALLTVFLSQYMRRTIIAPVQHIGDVCAGVTRGVFQNRVNIRNRDEIGVLGETVNTMVDSLHERYELSKFVSSSTLQSLKGHRDVVNDELTLFFTDIRSFTAYTEKHPAAYVVEHLNRLLNIQSEIIQKCGGDIDKYVGDEIVAIFVGEHKEERACEAALQIQAEVKRLGPELDGLAVGIGISTGTVILGMIGSQKRADFTVIGRDVNYASRLCSVAKEHQVVISSATQRGLPRSANFAGPFRIKVRGIDDYQRVYLLESLSGAPAAKSAERGT